MTNVIVLDSDFLIYTNNLLPFEGIPSSQGGRRSGALAVVVLRRGVDVNGGYRREALSVVQLKVCFKFYLIKMKIN